MPTSTPLPLCSPHLVSSVLLVAIPSSVLDSHQCNDIYSSSGLCQEASLRGYPYYSYILKSQAFSWMSRILNIFTLSLTSHLCVKSVKLLLMFSFYCFTVQPYALKEFLNSQSVVNGYVMMLTKGQRSPLWE